MQRVPSDEARNLVVTVWPEYQKIIDSAEGKKVWRLTITSAENVGTPLVLNHSVQLYLLIILPTSKQL